MGHVNSIHNEKLVKSLEERLDKLLAMAVGQNIADNRNLDSLMDEEEYMKVKALYGMYNDLKTDLEEWAREQDAIDNHNRIARETMCGTLEKQRRQLEKMEQKLDRICNFLVNK